MGSTRGYRSPLRVADAALTRARIVDAAGELFARDGYAATPLRAVAERAGVSVQSVHLAGPKWTLLVAAFEKTFAGDEGSHSLAERPVMAAIMAEPDSDEAIRRYVRFLVEANARSAVLWRVLHVAADGDPEIRVQVAALDDRRRKDLQLAAGWMLQRGLITPQQTAVTADALSFFTSPDAYLHFVVAAEWPEERYADWMETSLRGLITTRHAAGGQ